MVNARPRRPAPGVAPPADHALDGRSFLPLLRGERIAWRDDVLYEYYWEWNFPQTPTQFALRTDRYKYIFYYGVWDQDSFYDLQADPGERNDLASARPEMVAEMSAMLERLQQAVIENRNVFEVLMDAVQVCSLGQITTALFEVGGQYRRNM